MFKKKYSCIAIIILIFLMCGCSATKEAGASKKMTDQVKQETQEIISFPQTFTKDYNEQLKIDAEVIVPENVSGEMLYGVHAEIIKPDTELIKNKMIEYTGRTFEKFQELQQKDYQGVMVTDISYVDQEDVQFSLTYSDNQNSILYYPESLNYTFAAFRLSNDPDYNGDLYRKEEEFSFSTKDAAFEKVRNYFKDIGVEIGTDYRSYSLNYELLEQEEKVYEEKAKLGRKQWSENDNAYYFAVNQEIENIPLYVPLFDIYTDDIDYNAPIQVLYNNSGIAFIQTGNLYKLKSTKEALKPLKVEKIFDLIKEKYDLLISEDKVTLTKAKLCWMKQKDNTQVALAWSISGRTDSGVNIQLFYDAQTGKELLGMSL